MQRELPRTIYGLSRNYQRRIADLEYEIIVVDNGSPEPVDEAALRVIADNLRVIRVDPARPSPAGAINAAMDSAQGDMLGLFVDGARIASPGLIAAARDAFRSDNMKVIGSLGFHLGPDVQMQSVLDGYSQIVEDELLAESGWRDNGYVLFDISVLAASSLEGWFGCIAESNGVFLSRYMWERIGGFDERFRSPGGGVVNLDFWERAVAASDNQPWMILGEGTFHQIHGGAATNGTDDDRVRMFAEYLEIHGQEFQVPQYQPRLIGTLDRALAMKAAGKPAVQAGEL